MRNIQVTENIIDRAIAFIAPETALKRRQARVALALSGGYVAGSRSRRATQEWRSTFNDADADLLPDLPTIRERSRDLARNNPLAAGALNTKVTNVVGMGLKLQSVIDFEYLGISDTDAEKWQQHVEREFCLWADSQECDLERTQTFFDIQSMVFRSVLESGDAFVLTPMIERSGSPYMLKLQIVEGDRVSNPHWQRDTSLLSGGVEKDEYGAPIKYHIMKYHPGSIDRKRPEWESFPAFGQKTGRRNVLHLYRKVRPGQTRGIPDLAPVLEALKQLGDYTNAEVSAAVVSAMFTVFVTTPLGDGLAPMVPTSETGGSTADEDYKMAPGAILDLAPGEDVKAPNPGRPNPAFDGFVTAVLRQIGVALELPYEILIKHFTASYSAARAAMLEAWRFFMTQRQWLSKNFCQPIYEIWLTEAIALGRVNAPGYLDGDPAIRKAYQRAMWVGPARGQIDELKEVNAAETRVNLGVSSIARETAEMTGQDWEIVHKQRVKENKMRLDAGLVQIPAPKPSNPPDNNNQDPGNN